MRTECPAFGWTRTSQRRREPLPRPRCLRPAPTNSPTDVAAARCSALRVICVINANRGSRFLAATAVTTTAVTATAVTATAVTATAVTATAPAATTPAAGSATAHRRCLGDHRPITTARQSLGPPTLDQSAARRRRHPLPLASRLCLAEPTRRVPRLADRLHLLPQLAQRRHPAAVARGPQPAAPLRGGSQKTTAGRTGAQGRGQQPAAVGVADLLHSTRLLMHNVL